MQDVAPEQAPGPIHLNAVLDGLAGNPALPAILIRRLVAHRRGLGDVAKRPDLSADLIDEIIATNDQWLLHSLALNKHLPNPVRLQLAEHDDSAVRAALVVWSPADAPREMFARLINDPVTNVREYLAKSDHVPADLRARLADDPEPQVRATLAKWWTRAPETVRRKLLTDPAGQVRAAACATYYARLPHPIPPADLIAELLDDPVTRAGVVTHSALTDETAHWLSEDPDDDVRREVARHRQIPPGVRDRLGEDASARVRVAIFARPDTPDPLRARIYAEILQPRAPLTDLLGSDLDDETFLREVEDSIAESELRNLQLPWVTADPLPYLSSPYVCFRSSAARADSIPKAAVLRLLDDDESIVRTTAARHHLHLVDHATAERIDRDFRPDKKTSWRPADDFTFPPETLRRLATDPDPRMRCLAPRDPDLPAHLAELLAADPDNSVRHAVASHPRLPTPLLISLIDDQTEYVARAAAGSPALPPAHMDRLLALAGI